MDSIPTSIRGQCRPCRPAQVTGDVHDDPVALCNEWQISEHGPHLVGDIA
jgi:hypothetical protein